MAQCGILSYDRQIYLKFNFHRFFLQIFLGCLWKLWPQCGVVPVPTFQPVVPRLTEKRSPVCWSGNPKVPCYYTWQDHVLHDLPATSGRAENQVASDSLRKIRRPGRSGGTIYIYAQIAQNAHSREPRSCAGLQTMCLSVVEVFY